MTARDLTLVGLSLWMLLLACAVLLIVVLAERPDLRFRQYRIRRHNAKRKGALPRWPDVSKRDTRG